LLTRPDEVAAIIGSFLRNGSADAKAEAGTPS
jgi:hypothetical protein